MAAGSAPPDFHLLLAGLWEGGDQQQGPIQSPTPDGQGEHNHSLSTRLATEGQPTALMLVGGWRPVS